MTAERPGSRAEELDPTVLRTLSIKVKFAIVKLNIKNMKRLGIPWWASGQDFMLPGSRGLGSVPDWRTKIHKPCGEAKKKKDLTVVNQNLVIPYVSSTVFLGFYV